VKKLRETSFRALPEKVPAMKGAGPSVPISEWLTAEEPVRFWGTTVNSDPSEKNLSALLVFNSTDDDLDKIRGAVNRFRDLFPKNSFAYGLHPRGGPFEPWTMKNPPNTVERSLALLGQTVDTGRFRDVISYVVHARQVNAKHQILGEGRAGVIGLYVALLCPDDIKEVVILNPPTSHRDGPHFLNVDRVLDLPTALGLLAPDVKLTLINAKDPAFDKTAAIYKLAGAADKFERK